MIRTCPIPTRCQLSPIFASGSLDNQDSQRSLAFLWWFPRQYHETTLGSKLTNRSTKTKARLKFMSAVGVILITWRQLCIQTNIYFKLSSLALNMCSSITKERLYIYHASNPLGVRRLKKMTGTEVYRVRRMLHGGVTASEIPQQKVSIWLMFRNLCRGTSPSLLKVLVSPVSNFHARFNLNWSRIN